MFLIISLCSRVKYFVFYAPQTILLPREKRRSEYDTFPKLGRREASESISRTRRLECSIDRKISHLGCASCLYMSAPGGDDYSASSAVYTAVAAPPLVGGGCHSVSTTAPSDDDTAERERGWNWLRITRAGLGNRASCGVYFARILLRSPLYVACKYMWVCGLWVYVPSLTRRNTHIHGHIHIRFCGDARKASTTDLSVQSEGVGWSYLETKWIGLEIQISICLPLSTRVAQTHPSQERKVIGYTLPRLPSRINARIFGFGWTHRTNGRFVIG